ncbi:MAG TPA: putative DNA binding domain-containing protein [bacterium]|nr:putative DNA binding domain-containing protein [bacterium]
MFKSLEQVSKYKLLESILATHEWYNFDCKRAKIKPRKLLETAVAFANTDGGIIAIGVEDPEKAKDKDRLIGISEGVDNVTEFVKLLDKEIDPFLGEKQFYELDIENVEGQADKILIIQVAKSQEVHSLKNGDTFVRKGDQNIKIGNREITRLKYEKGTIKFEAELTGIKSLEGFDKELFEQFKADNHSRSINDFQFLKDNGLAVQTNSGYELTKGGVLLFDQNPSVRLGGKYGIKISHYYGTSQSFTKEPNFVRKPFTIEGSLLNQIQHALDYFKDIVRLSPPKLDGAKFYPTILIPEWVFQEAVTNAVIHRNYSVQDDIHIRFFDDRIEIESPGSYPGFITPLNIRTERYARNPLIQRTLNRFNASPNLDIGEGVDRMFEVMSQENLYEPLFFPSSLRPNSVLLVLLNQQKISYWDTVSNYLDNNHQITNADARRITGIQDTIKMSRILKDWVDKKLLFKIQSGFKGNTLYRKHGVKDLDPFSGGNENGKG